MTEQQIALNKGRTSPRFAFMERFTIPNRLADGDYLYRLRLIDTPWFGLYIHVIADCDPDPHLHNHPAGFFSLILAGGYTESFKANAHAGQWTRKHKRFSLNRIHHGNFHKITKVDGPVWSLVFRGKRHGSWGFLVRGKVVDYTEYLDPEKWGSGYSPTNKLHGQFTMRDNTVGDTYRTP